MILTSSQQQHPPTSSDDSHQIRGNIQLRRSDSNKTVSDPTIVTKSGNIQMPINNNVINSRSRSNPLPNNSNNDNTSSMNNRQEIQNEELSVLTGHYACARYFLFLVYLLLLISLIMNTFLHFIFYGSNMSIGSMFLDVHHRQELINGEYYSLTVYLSENYQTKTNNIPSSHHHHHYHRSDTIHCDRSQFLSLLDEFYHQYPIPKPSTLYEERNLNGQSQSLSNPSKSYPKIFTNFNNYARSKEREDLNEDDIYYSRTSSSSGTLIDEPESRKRQQTFQQQQQQQQNNNNKNENRLLIIEVIALILLFITVLNQVLGLIAVIKKHLLLLIFVTIIDSFLFCILVFIANIGFILLLLLAMCGGYLFIFQFKIGLQKKIKERIRLKEDISSEVQDAIIQMRNRMSPCIHVSMEQYEAMTQQMLHRYSSPIVYCPHYNESLC